MNKILKDYSIIYSRIFLLIYLMTMSFNVALAQENVDRSERANIENLLSDHNVPGLSLAVLDDYRIQEISVYGDLKRGIPVEIDSYFNVASLAKPIVAMLTLELVQLGEWELDKPLENYWVDPDIKDHPFTKKLTTRHVLSHRTGFDNWRHLNESKQLAFNFEPGKKFMYSGEGFEYLQKALERKFGLSLDELAFRYLFKKIGMNQTQFRWDENVIKEQFAHWHDAEGNNSYPTYFNNESSAADDLLTTIWDYAKFAEFVINGASLDQDLFQNMVSTHSESTDDVQIGLGWEILHKSVDSEYALLHTGGDVGVNTLIVLLPKSGKGLVIFTNGDNGRNLYFPLINLLLRESKFLFE